MGVPAVMSFLEETTFLGMTLLEVIYKVLLLGVTALVAGLAEKGLSRAIRHALKRSRVPSVSFLVNMMRAVIWMLALMVVLEPVFGVKPTAFVAALGIGSVALSLGMQDTMSNIIGGLALMVSKVIEPGDVIKFGDFTGTVADINWRATCVVDAYGQVNIIPNSVISKTAVVKLSTATKNCCVLQLVVRHGSDLDAVHEDVIRVANECLGEWVDQSRDPWVTVISMDGGGMPTQVSVPLMSGVSADLARTRLAGGLTRMPWVVKPAV